MPKLSSVKLIDLSWLMSFGSLGNMVYVEIVGALHTKHATMRMDSKMHSASLGLEVTTPKRIMIRSLREKLSLLCSETSTTKWAAVLDVI
jgi:hypothetical protein